MELIPSLLGSLVTFVVSLLVGGLGIFVGAVLVRSDGDVWKALWTAVFGSLAWALAMLFVGWIPLLGGIGGLILGLIFYLGVISYQYDADFTDAAAIAFVAWIAVVVARWFLGPVGALGVPFA